MSPENGLEIKSTIEKHPLAELIVEIRQNSLGGSLRLSFGVKKAIIYFDDGRLIYAVSNAREHRLFSHLLKEKLIEQKELAQFPNFAKDHELAAALKAAGRLSEEQLTEAAKAIVRQIVLDSLSWIKGDFTFTPLARVRDDLKLDVEIGDLLMNYGRCFDSGWVINRFRSFDEMFDPIGNVPEPDGIRENEKILLDAFVGQALSAEALRAATRMPESLLFSGLYTIWLGGYVKRANWNPAFSDLDLKNLSSAKLHLVKKAEDVRVARPAAQNGDGTFDEAAQSEENIEPIVELSAEEYLARFENYESLYDLLAIDQNAPARVVREKYLALARSFHPDRYRREDPELFKKMQAAFTELSFAHETLRDERLRRNYDQKLESERAMRKRVAERGGDANEKMTQGEESGLQNFEAALGCLTEGDLAGAATHLARAVHYSPQNALYHAHYGKVLAESAQFKFKAEGELQTAVRLDAKNWKIREMLIEFYTDYDMVKRAEGEIGRFLELVPNHKEALAALARIRA
ncbi:MAG: DnaJ domain-containing protein [Acidobacteria bacterium]|nr:DnaJ domain-containing protein [Acidobacteriota bacterium]